MSKREALTLSGTVENFIFCNFKFTFQQGIHIIIGSNGTGKTTLLKTICDLSKNEGHVMLNESKAGHDVFTYFFSGDTLGEDEMSIKETIFYYSKAKKKEIEEQYQELMMLFELKKHENVLIKSASEGMKQKMNIIICLLNRKRIVMLDEPFNYLDEKACINLVHYLQEYQRKEDNIIIISTNDLSLLKEFDKYELLDLSKMGNAIRR